jgi:hypothetical protein
MKLVLHLVPPKVEELGRASVSVLPILLHTLTPAHAKPKTALHAFLCNSALTNVISVELCPRHLREI